MLNIVLTVLLLSGIANGATTTKAHQNLITCGFQNPHGFVNRCAPIESARNLSLFPGHTYESQVDIHSTITCDKGTPWDSGFRIGPHSIDFNTSNTYSFTTKNAVTLTYEKSYLEVFGFNNGCELSVNVVTKTPSDRLMQEWRDSLEAAKEHLEIAKAHEDTIKELIGLKEHILDFDEIITALLEKVTLSQDAVNSMLATITCESKAEFNPSCNPLAKLAMDPNLEAESRLSILELLSSISSVSSCKDDECNVSLQEKTRVTLEKLVSLLVSVEENRAALEAATAERLAKEVKLDEIGARINAYN